jgi:hypothetical protein
MTHEFCDHCEGCRPALLDLTTGQPLPADSPLMLKVNQIWNHQTTYAERKAFIDVTVHNSRDAETVRLARAVIERIEGIT